MNSRKRCGLGLVVLTVVLLVVPGPWALAQGQGTTRFTRSNSGLVDDFVSQFADFNGVLAVGTQNGLTLIHPDRFESWKRGENGFPDASVVAATVFGGRLWVGTHGRGVARLEDGRWKTFTQSDAGLLDNFVTALQPQGNRLFIGTRAGLCAFDGLLCETIRFPGNQPLRVTSLAGDGGALLAGTEAGLFRVGVDGVVSPVTLDLTPEPAVDAVALDRGTIFVAGEFGVIAIGADGRRQAWGREKFPSTRFASLFPGEGGVLAGTARGLVQARPDGSVAAIALEDLGGRKTLPITTIVRSGGAFWIGSMGGGVGRLASLPAVSGTRVPGVGVSDGPGPGTSPLTDVVVFPPPSSTGGAGTPGATIASADPSSGNPGSRPRPHWTSKKKTPKPKNLKFYQDILPIMVKECHACHTTGRGKGFPLNDPTALITYFKKVGADRFNVNLDQGGGMVGQVDPKTAELIQIWVKEGCKE